jgi:glutaredoxin 3
VANTTVSQSSPVKIFTTMICPYCIRAKMLLKKKGIPYEEVDVGGDRAAREWLIQVSGGRRTVPQIFVKGESIGGFDELAALDRAGRLDAMLA